MRNSRRLHLHVASALRKYLHTHGQPGTRLEPVRALAGKLGVSIATLRTAQALLAEEGLLEARHGSGVYVTERTTSRRVGIVCELDITHPRTSPFFHSLVWSLRQALRKRGVLSHLYVGEVQPAEIPPAPTCWKFLDDLAARRLDGIVALSHTGSGRWPLTETDSVPLVGTQGCFPHCVMFDQTWVVREALRQLSGRGCRRIAALAWNRQSFAEEFSAELRSVGLECRPGWVRCDLSPELEGAGWEEIREVWSAYEEKPDGLLVADDVLLMGATQAIRELGIRVPEQLRLVGVVNKGSSLRPVLPATLLEFDPIELAQHLATMLVQLMNREPVDPPQVLLRPRLLTPTPTGAPPLELVRAGEN